MEFLRKLLGMGKVRGQVSDEATSLPGTTAAELSGSQALEPLVAALKAESPKARGAAASRLGEVGGKQAVASLIAALQDTDKDVRMDVIRALGAINDQRAVEPLLVALKNDRPTFVVTSRVLGEFHDTRAVEPLIAALGDGNPVIRECAAKALGMMGDVRAIEPLERTSRSAGQFEQFVQQAADEALRQIRESANKEPRGGAAVQADDTPGEQGKQPNTRSMSPIGTMDVALLHAVVLAKLNLYTEHGSPWGYPDERWQAFFVPECTFSLTGGEIVLTMPDNTTDDYHLRLKRFDRAAITEVFLHLAGRWGSPGTEIVQSIKDVLRPYAVQIQTPSPEAYSRIRQIRGSA
jgi:hypothetical protein